LSEIVVELRHSQEMWMYGMARSSMSAGAAFFVLTLTLSAQSADVRGPMADVLRYTGLESPSAGDVARMAELWTRAQQPDIAREERRLAFRDLFVSYARLHGRDVSGRPEVLDGLTQFVMTTYEGGGRMNLRLPEPRGKPTGRYLHVERRGHGPTRLLLISDLGVDGRKLYDSFARRQDRAYAMEIVTLPYAGGARRLPWPETLDYSGRPWLNQVERELLALLDEPRMKGVMVIGTSGGGYFAARLALLRPKAVRSVVLVNALVSTSMRALDNPDAPASREQRLLRVKSTPPAPLLFPVAPLPPPDELRRLIADPASRHPTARNWMAFAVKDTTVSRAWTFEALADGFLIPSLEYGQELASTDLTEEMKTLAVPMLAIGSWHDEGSPARNVPTISQWEEMKLRYPTVPLTIAVFTDTRHYISADAPEAFDRALADFLAGRPVRVKTSDRLPRPNPRASVSQSVAGAEVTIAYGRPPVNGRVVWGALVPNGRVWSPGANEATTLTCDREISVEGRTLPAGTYTLFAIPGDAEWTLILNRVPRQSGAFDYNPAFDALRVPVKSVEAPHEEYLRYAIEPAGANGAVVTLTWEKRAVSFQLSALSFQP
jgi:pimeloyl-ACP methyl ester carboxylesterase